MIAKGYYSEAERQRIVSLLHDGHSPAELAEKNGIAPMTIEAWDEEESARHEIEEMYASAISSKDNFVVSPPEGRILVSRLLFFLKSHWVMITAVLIIVLCVMTFYFSFNRVKQRISPMSQTKAEQQLDSVTSAIDRVEVHLGDIDRSVEVQDQYSDTMRNTLSVLSDDVKRMNRNIIYWRKHHHQCCNDQKEDSLINHK